MDDLLTVVTATSELRGASLHLAQEVRRGDEVLVSAAVVVACVRNAGRSGCPSPCAAGWRPLPQPNLNLAGRLTPSGPGPVLLRRCPLLSTDSSAIHTGIRSV